MVGDPTAILDSDDCAAVCGVESQETASDDLAAIDADYQTHCVECFMGMPEHCTEGLAPNGQPCVTTPAERIAWLLDVVQRVVAQRNAANSENAALTARLAAVAAERALLSTVAEWASTLRRRAQSHEDERLYDQAVARLDGALYALMRYQRAQREEPTDGR